MYIKKRKVIYTVSDIYKTVDVIKSCETFEQLKVAEKMVLNMKGNCINEIKGFEEIINEQKNKIKR